MARRFVTVEDIRRVQGKELLVDESTIVTPQALEAAQAAGIAIHTQSGAWREPAPDRGPDAPRAAMTMPAMPEPAGWEEGANPTGIVVTAVGKNRPGVLAEITATLGRYEANVENISQRMLDQFFHLVLTVTLPPGCSFGELKRELQCLGGEDDYVVRVMHERVFRYMHRI